jgi:hypothetical protein
MPQTGSIAVVMIQKVRTLKKRREDEWLCVICSLHNLIGIAFLQYGLESGVELNALPCLEGFFTPPPVPGHYRPRIFLTPTTFIELNKLHTTIKEYGMDILACHMRDSEKKTRKIMLPKLPL